jgi:hypothetical protein
MLEVLARMKRKDLATVHGFRASFRTWVHEATSFPWELAEMSLGHKVGSKVEQAYIRGNGLRKRIAASAPGSRQPLILMRTAIRIRGAIFNCIAAASLMLSSATIPA